MIRIHSDSNLTFPEDKVKIKVNPVILNFFSSGFTKKEITQELKTEIENIFINIFQVILNLNPY